MKLLIDIPKDLYDMTRTPNNVNYIMRMAGFICSAIANGTPLDDVKAEFINRYPKNWAGEPELGGASCEFSLCKVLEILDNIGKKESEDK